MMGPISNAGRRPHRPVLVLGMFAAAVLVELPQAAAGDEVSFRNDVMAVLSKAGCNAGVCHGNLNGKGGFKLSLRGQDPELDFAALSRDVAARRANPLQPDQSLVLLKPTMQVPHEGGRRFDRDSQEYGILQRWIAAGMPSDDADTPRLEQLTVSPAAQVVAAPEDRLQLSVQATYSDGSTRDVTTLAVYELAEQTVEVRHDGLIVRRAFGETTVLVRLLDRYVPVRVAFIPERPDYVWKGPAAANFIDEHIFAKLRSLRMNPSELCSDAVFLRRAYLDLLGILPTADEARQFVSDARGDKRARLVDELLQRPEFADVWAQKWSDLLRNEEKTLDRKGVQNFHAWIRGAIAGGMPLDEFARELVQARGSSYANPASNYYRAMRDPLTRAESTAQVFLGIRLQCVKCHNHPFDHWTQDDYYGWANLFARVEYEVLENDRRDRNDKHEFNGEQIVYIDDSGEVEHPGTGRPVPPRFLGTSASPVDPDEDRLVQLAEWIADAQNDRFVRMQVNRIWYHLMGRGIVDPIDDFRATNPASHPELLDALAADLVSSGFDLRHLIRRIMNSHAYQHSSVPNDSNRDDVANYSHALIRRLSAEQMADAVSQVTGAVIEYNGYPVGMRAGELPGVQAQRRRDESPAGGDQFLKLFGKPPRLQTCECERSVETTLNQAFELVSGPLINELLTQRQNRISALLESGQSDAEMIDTLYWTALSRAPSPEELAATAKYLSVKSEAGNAAAKRSALEDVLWGLLNANEFVLRR